MTLTKEELNGGLQAIFAVAEAIREAGEIPSGTLYAMLIGKMNFQAYEKMLAILKNAGLISVNAHLIRWTGPALA